MSDTTEKLLEATLKSFRHELCNDHDPENVRLLRGIWVEHIEEWIKKNFASAFSQIEQSTRQEVVGKVIELIYKHSCCDQSCLEDSIKKEIV